MKKIETPLEGLFIFEPTIFDDSRGYFYESYNKKKLSELKVNVDFIQDNQSQSKKGTIRGIHFQTGIFAQSKLVRATQGEILDVAVDLRPDSETFCEYFSVILTAENHRQLFIPKGFGHGFSVLSDTAVLNYKCDNFYDRESEDGIHPFDSSLKIDWKVEQDKAIFSEKDASLGTFNEFKDKYPRHWW